MCSGPGGWLSAARSCGYRSSSSSPPGRPGSTPTAPGDLLGPRSQHVSTAQGCAFRTSLGTVTGQQWPLNRPAFALGGMTPFTEARPRPIPSPPGHTALSDLHGRAVSPPQASRRALLSHCRARGQLQWRDGNTICYPALEVSKEHREGTFLWV